MALENRLAAIPFGALIGGPLSAAIEAQGQAAMTTVKFIREVGLTEDNKVQTITFKLDRKSSNGQDETLSLEVPLLTVVPIPFIRIDDVSINFKASLTESGEETSADKLELKADASVEASGKFFTANYGFKASVSSKKDSSSTRNSKYAVEYTMDINVHAVQDDMPAGMSRVLNALVSNLEKQISTSTSAPSEKPGEKQ